MHRRRLPIAGSMAPLLACGGGGSASEETRATRRWKLAGMSPDALLDGDEVRCASPIGAAPFSAGAS